MSTFWQEVLARPREVYARLSRGQRLGVLALASVAIVVAVLASMLAGRESFVMLYGGLEPSDANEMVSKLTELGAPYRLSPDGTMVQVPEQRVAEIKMQLAASGLPRLGSRGFELFDESQIGLTDSLFNVNLQRAIQGELEKSIQSCGPVKRARVMVYLQPQASVVRERERGSASVTLWLRQGMPLVDSQVAAIAHLVASGIGHGLRPQDVKIADSNFNLLHPRGDPDDPMFSAAYLERVQSMERYLQEKAESQLRSLGEGKASVRVSVELDLTHKETASEKVDPENKVAVKSTTSKDVSGGDQASGGDPSVAAAARTAGRDGSGAVLHSDTEDEYREGIERQLLIQGAGSIKSMSVSLLLDDGDAALTAKQADLEKLVKNAVGFKEKRDSFQVASATFAKPPPPEKAPGPFALENLLPLLGHVAEGITVLFVLVLLTRTLRGSGASARRKTKGVTTAAGGTAEEGTVAEQEEDVLVDLKFAEGKGADLRTKLGRFVNRHPDQAREVLVAWLKEEVAS